MQRESWGSQRRNIAVVAAVAVAISSVAACSSSASSTKSDGGDAKSFTYWSMWKADEPQAKVIQKALDSYQASTGVTVTVQWKGRSVLQNVADTIKAGQPVPDLVDGSINTVMSQLVTGGHAADLSGLYKQKVPGEDAKLGDVVPDKYVPLLTDTVGDVVMVPYEVASEALYYDAAKQPQLAGRQPQNWDEFMTALNTVKAKGQAPLALDPIGGNCAYWTEWMFERELGPGQFRKTAEEKDPAHVDGGSRWDDGRLLDGAKKLEALVRGGYFAPGYASEDTTAASTHAKDQQNAWASGHAAMILGGTWTPSETAKQLADSAKTVDSFVFPPMPDTNGVRSDNSASVNFFGFAVPKESKNGGAAGKFILYFMNKDRLTPISTEAGNMTPRIDIPAPPALASVQLALTDRTVFPDQDALMRDDSAWYTRVFQPNSQEFMTGKLTATAFVAQLRADSAKFWAANSNAQ